MNKQVSKLSKYVKLYLNVSMSGTEVAVDGSVSYPAVSVLQGLLHSCIIKQSVAISSLEQRQT